jgi:hypothetical protein
LADPKEGRRRMQKSTAAAEDSNTPSIFHIGQRKRHTQNRRLVYKGKKRRRRHEKRVPMPMANAKRNNKSGAY